MATVFLRLLAHDDKAAALVNGVGRLRAGKVCRDVHVVDPESFQQVPGSPFAYWLSDRIRRLFCALPPLERNGCVARQGGVSGDDFRWLRIWTEVSSVSGPMRFVPIAKGGKFSRFYSDLPLTAIWDEEKGTFWGFSGLHHRPPLMPASFDYYFRPGLTWPRRSQKGLSFRVLPSGCIFGDKGPSIFDESEHLAPLLGVINSSAFRELVSLQMAFGSYEAGVIQRTPVPDLSVGESQVLGKLAMSCVKSRRDLDRSDEISHVFCLPGILLAPGKTIADRTKSWQVMVAVADLQFANLQHEIDDIAFRLYGIDGEDRRAIEEQSGLKSALVDEAETEDDEVGDAAGPSVDSRPLTAALVPYATGCIVGRWDLRYATGERPTPELPDPFDPLPVCSPGMLQDDDGLPLQTTPAGYPLRIDWDGILVDDSNHSDDIIRRVRDVLEVIWKDRAEAIEKEACDILGMSELRDYFRKPGAGRFWDDHIKRYSKSRRKAPIYWLLQSTRKYWEELLEGKYEWSSIGKQLREKGLVK